MRRVAPAALVLFAAACVPQSGESRPNAEPQPAIINTSTTTMVRVSADNSIPVETVRAPIDRVWAALPGVYQELGIPMGMTDPATYTYGNRRVTGNRIGGVNASEWVRCGNAGSGPSAMSSLRMQLTVITTLQASAEGVTSVATQVSGSGTPTEGTSSGAVLCVSNGKLEMEIAKVVRRRVGV
jgi:hypothetical protein